MGERKKTRQILVGKVKMGGGAPVTIQSMLNTPAEDFAASVEQAKRLEAAGCEIIRAAIPNLQSVPLIEHLKNAVSVPIVADIHFDYRLALEAVAAGVDKVRINPGNIGDEDRVRPGCAVLQASQCPHPCGGQLRAAWKSTSWQSTATPPRRRWWTVRCTTSR